MSAFSPLRLRQDEHHLCVTGTTSTFTIDKGNGLITALQVRGASWLAGPLPNLWASPDIDQRQICSAQSPRLVDDESFAYVVRRRARHPNVESLALLVCNKVTSALLANTLC